MSEEHTTMLIGFLIVMVVGYLPIAIICDFWKIQKGANLRRKQK